MKQIAYLGPAGTFSEMAAGHFIKQHQITPTPVRIQSIPALFTFLKNTPDSAIIVPVENSIEGPVTITMDLLVQTPDIFINQEMTLPIIHCLMARHPITDLNTITDLFSHPQPFAQCQHYIQKHLSHCAQHPMPSTAAAAQTVQKNSMTFTDTTVHINACIGPEELSTLYQLHILKKEINDYKDNVTRFLILQNHQTQNPTANKTSIIFTSKKEIPGSLYDVLGEFAKRQINLTSIQSRPSKTQLGDYLFFIDFEGNINDPIIQEALTQVQNKASFYKPLGSYNQI